MFTITTEKKDYQTYTLTDSQANSTLEIVPERGGIVTTWRYQNQDIFYFDAERFRDPQKSVRGGIPILFPICGNLPDNTYAHQGQSYTLKQHGFARDLPWEVAEQATDSCASITLVLDSNEKTRAVYPFDFKIAFTYQLQGNILTLKQSYTNNSETAMPFSTGLHPYFLVTAKDPLEFEIPASQLQDHITQEFRPFAGSFDFSLEEIDVALLSPTQQKASISDRQRGLKITLDYSPIYSTLVFWTVKGKDYVCLEPWSAKRNAINTGENLIHLEPGKSCEAVVNFYVSNLD